MSRLQVPLRPGLWPSGRPLSPGSELQAPLARPLFAVRPRVAPCALTGALMWRALPPPFTLPTRSLGALTPVGLIPQRGKLEAQGWGELGAQLGLQPGPCPGACV